MYQQNIFLQSDQSVEEFIAEAASEYGINVTAGGVNILGMLLATDFCNQLGHFDEGKVCLTFDLVELKQLGELDPKTSFYMVTKLLVANQMFLVKAYWRIVQGPNPFGAVYTPPSLGADYWQNTEVVAWFDDLNAVPGLASAIEIIR